MFAKGSKSGQFVRRQITNYMLSNIKKPELREKLIPNFEMGCKRITVSNDYVKSFNAPHARLVTEKIDRIVSNGVMIRKTEGEKQVEELIPCDALVFATGFNLLASTTNIRVVGRNGRVLSEVWGQTPNAYLGMSVPDFPNMFYLLGPNVGLGHNSVVWMIECQVTYCMDAVLKCIRQDVKALDVKTEKNRSFQEFIQSLMKFRPFHSGCKSWYQNSQGIVFTLWPSHLLHYWWMTRKINMADYVVDKS